LHYYSPAGLVVVLAFVAKVLPKSFVSFLFENSMFPESFDEALERIQEGKCSFSTLEGARVAADTGKARIVSRRRLSAW
jgi:hypothetical protein